MSHNALPMFVAGVDLSEVKFSVGGTTRQCRNMSTTEVPCLFLCEPFCICQKAGFWISLVCHPARNIHTYVPETLADLDIDFDKFVVYGVVF